LIISRVIQIWVMTVFFVSPCATLISTFVHSATLQGCQTHFHWGPYQHYVCLQRASCNC